MKRFLLSCILFTIPAVIYSQGYTVQLQSGQFIPKVIKPAEVRWSNNEVVNEYYFRYIQFYQLPTEAEKKQLESKGILIYNYLPANTFTIAIPSSVNITTINSRNIRSIFPITIKNKLDVLLAKKKYPKWALRGNGLIELMVLHQEGITDEATAELLLREGYRISHTLPGLKAHRLTVHKSQINKLASLPYISYIEPFNNDPQPENLVGRTDHRSNMIATDYASGLHYDGTGVNVGLNDDGVIGPHIDYKGRIINQYTTSNTLTNNHGDHCAGTIMAGGNRDPKGRGMAFGAKIAVYRVSSTYPSGYQGFDSIYKHYNSIGVRITSTSYSDGLNAGYTTRARLMDMQIDSMPELMHVFSSGNEGSSTSSYGAGATWGTITGGHKQAKNCITVGNLTYQDVLATSSSRGPAYDGRIKPDVCAVGTDVYSTVNSNIYELKTGTSMSCPGVSGTITQLYHGYKATHGGNNPPSALIKAVLLNTADDLGNPGPDYKHGWGRVNARRAFALLQNNQFIIDSLSQGGIKTHTLSVPAGVSEVRVMVYWPDQPATAGAAKAIINNLNMTVVTPASTTVFPWVLNSAPNATTLNQNAVQGIDSLNNMEQVTITSPAPGNYTVNISGASVPQGPQKYYVVYEYVVNNITLIYPSGGESLVPAVQETIRWDAYGNSGTFTVEYSTNNGGSWTTIASGIAATQRYFNWAPPSVVTGQALVRVTRGTQSDVSDTMFSIIGVPTGLTVNWVCIDSIRVSYNPVSGATGYIVTVLGNKYMDSAAYSTTTSCVVKNINTINGGWYSVQAVAGNNCKGRRAYADTFFVPPYNCNIPNDVGAFQPLFPTSATLIDCNSASHTDSVVIVIKNNGANPLSNINLGYSVNGGTPVTAVYPGPLNAAAIYVYKFSQPLIFATPGSYTIKAWVQHPTDITTGNDTLTWQKDIFNPTVITLPYTENFETFTSCDTTANCSSTICAMSLGWNNGRNATDDDIDWRINSGPTPTASQAGTTGPMMDFDPGLSTGQYAYLESTLCDGKQGDLITPCIDLTNATNAQLKFAYHMFGTGMGDLHVDLFAFNLWTSDIIPPIQGNKGNSWQQAVVPLSSYAGQVVNVRFRGITGTNGTSDMAIDNVRVYDPTGVNHLAADAGIKVYPNPSDGTFNLSFTKAISISSISITTLDGKMIYKDSNEIVANGNTTIPIKLNNTPAGIYLLSIQTENGKVNRKLIKL
jgi:hypothetical protein